MSRALRRAIFFGSQPELESRNSLNRKHASAILD